MIDSGPWQSPSRRCLTGHVVGGTLVTTAGALLVAAVGALVGFRPIAGLLDWLAVIGMIAIAAFAITWISVALGLQARNPNGKQHRASGGAAADPRRRLCPARVHAERICWFAQYQPFTPLIGTLRGLFFRSVPPHQALIAIAWFLTISVVGYSWARNQYRHRRAHEATTYAEAARRPSADPHDGQLADYVGVTVRAIRHYHQRGLLAEPPRDASGYLVTTPRT